LAVAENNVPGPTAKLSPLKKIKDLLYWLIFRKGLRLWMRFRLARGQRAAVGTNPPEKKKLGMARASVFFINLDHRTDRLKEINAEFHRLGVKDAIRVSGVTAAHGGTGNAISHVVTLGSRVGKGDELLMVCEDDAEFLVDRNDIDELIEEFANTPYLDVLCLGNASLEPAIPVSNRLAVANHIQTTSCYVMKPRAVPILARSAARASFRLLSGVPFARASFDRGWKVEQQKLLFCIPLTRAVRQRPSFSDVEQKDVAYRA
jgi:hypothetical protein